MAIPTSSSPGSATDAQTNSPAAPIDVAAAVSELAAKASSRDEFLQWVAAHLGEWMKSPLVAVQDTTWGQPRMLIRDENLARGIDREQIRHLLETSTPSVTSTTIACDPAAAGIVMAGAEAGTCGGLSAELMPEPIRCSLLVVQPYERDATEILPAMRMLASTGDAVRASRFHIESRPSTGEENHETTQTNALVPVSDGATRDTSMLPIGEFDRDMPIRASLRRFHGSLDPTTTAYTIASELPRLLSCDRAVVLTSVSRRRKNRRYRVTAISGSSVVDRRSPLVRTMNALADRLAILGEPVVLPPPVEPGLTQDEKSKVHDKRVDELPPQVVEALEDYLDESGVLSVTVLPIFAARPSRPDAALQQVANERFDTGSETASRDESSPIAMLMLETFSGESSGLTSAMTEVCQEASTALGNAIRYNDVFVLPMRRPLAGMTQAAIRNWSIVIILFLAGLAAASWFIRVDHTVVATGVARPVERRAVFATVDGVVDLMHVRDGQRVETGDVLVSLENAEIARETQSLSGQLATATEKLASLRAMQLAANDDPRRAAQTAIEQATLESEIRTIGRRLKINASMQEDLTIRAPISGVIVGWRLDEKLRSRPVSRGDRLFAIVAPEGEWELDLKLPEDNAGEVMRIHHGGKKLPVRFAIASQPTQTYDAVVAQIGGVARRRADATNVVDVVASVLPDSNGPLRQDGFRGDVDVTAKIVCSPRRLIDSLSDELVAWWHRHVLFRFR
ncbi:HlyD family secretion protein [Aporhodopirellula aestuarii]|uniref:HlyD family efflux transporter periplasmic adaptor subunit n=1 Tax=Aporhodopirellula aestuarii TaxID=2950107 RepID=A0ABT0TXU8_9BACT|nr:HlyD family efflux transporter periplasmic adaptor subunit [Aporhodopirellula aestuarii]MCM2369421.1 HlyD family efflux transporter periplasmic adaptor subunit [Aporhodopirellula aestuarii]